MKKIDNPIEMGNMIKFIEQFIFSVRETFILDLEREQKESIFFFLNLN